MTAEKQKLGRIAPHSFESEEAVLGCILINPNAMSQSIQIISSSDFYNSSNATIYQNMVDLFNNNTKIDYVSLIEQLKKNKSLKNVGDAYYITGLSERAPSSENVEYYARIVKEKSLLRNIINVAVTITSDAYEDSEDVTHILDKAEQTLFSISQDAQKKKFVFFQKTPVYTKIIFEMYFLFSKTQWKIHICIN